MHRSLLAGLLLVSGFALVGCAGSSKETRANAARTGLYQRLGGKGAIAAVTDELLKRCAADERINARFLNADLPRLRQGLIDQICQVTGGPCTYTGKDMKTAHTGMHIREDEFNALVEDLKGALTQLKVPGHEQNELIELLAPMKPDVVGQ